ncbi:hypothetical protein HDV57DRAFT_40267 [Trichoderma longibrachiatum]|uniref:Uncharacterized protein n=1 Tax=Trichoderma longibrachiatum ATCC 18648 TaxID=983965 RepID=A0A2T4CHF5_TRILO|nr:hypothetical protein M440DRAFT_74120 [Trichoderma longibrachiatum ATCC 18648]
MESLGLTQVDVLLFASESLFRRPTEPGTHRICPSASSTMRLPAPPLHLTIMFSTHDAFVLKGPLAYIERYLPLCCHAGLVRVEVRATTPPPPSPPPGKFVILSAGSRL